MRWLAMTKILLSMNKYWLIASAICLTAPTVWAEDSAAVAFGTQAGIVAGAAQACNQSISLMTSRTDEVISALATDPTDAKNAQGAYKRAVEDANASQNLSQKLSCSKVVGDFNNLPLLRPDYQQTVIAPLLKDRPTQTNSTSTTNQTTPVAATPATVPPPTTSQAQAQATPTATAPASTAAPAYTNPAATTSQLQQSPQGTPTQQVVNANPNPAANSAAATEAARLQLAQKLADMAQTLVSGNPPAQAAMQQQFTTNPYQSSIGYETSNPQTQQYLNGVGANMPAINNSLGVTPYPAGQTPAGAAAASDPGLQPYNNSNNTTSAPASLYQ